METLLTHEARKQVIQLLLDRKRAEYSEIVSLVGMQTTRPDYHLSLLVKEGILHREERGTYTINPRAISSLRQKFNIVVPIVLVGGLGTEITLYADILDALAQQSILPRKYVLLTSPEIGIQFNKTYPEEKRDIETQLIQLEYPRILRGNLSLLREKLTEIVEELLGRNNLICELTGGTKPVTIALLEISHNYNLRKMYFSGKKILWL